ncbi:MAG: hypothetical protein JWN08_1826 [Frankiales bacterium]|nr:hypothetical protein [Frankiales bacterium]
MGIFKHGKHEPGAASQPEGDGPVTLDDRTEPSGQGSPDTNQGRTEPMSPTPDHPEPAVDLPTLDQMSVGSADPQAPSHPAAGGALSPATAGSPPQRLSGPGSDVDDQRPVIDTQTSTGASTGPLQPESQTSGTASRTPGSLGEVPAGEAVDTDVVAGASRMAPQGPGAREPLSSRHGDTGPSPATGDGPAPGTSEDHAIVTGVRMPDAE